MEDTSIPQSLIYQHKAAVEKLTCIWDLEPFLRDIVS